MCAHAAFWSAPPTRPRVRQACPSPSGSRNRVPALRCSGRRLLPASRHSLHSMGCSMPRDVCASAWCHVKAHRPRLLIPEPTARFHAASACRLKEMGGGAGAGGAPSLRLPDRTGSAGSLGVGGVARGIGFGALPANPLSSRKYSKDQLLDLVSKAGPMPEQLRLHQTVCRVDPLTPMGKRPLSEGEKVRPTNFIVSRCLGTPGQRAAIAPLSALTGTPPLLWTARG